VLPCAEIIRRVISEAEAVIARMSKTVKGRAAAE
jgi:hypothetical protein